MRRRRRTPHWNCNWCIKSWNLNIKWSNNRAHLWINYEFCNVRCSQHRQWYSNLVFKQTFLCIKYISNKFKWVDSGSDVDLWLNLIQIHVLLSKLNMIIELIKQISIIGTKLHHTTHNFHHQSKSIFMWMKIISNAWTHDINWNNKMLNNWNHFDKTRIVNNYYNSSFLYIHVQMIYQLLRLALLQWLNISLHFFFQIW